MSTLKIKKCGVLSLLLASACVNPSELPASFEGTVADLDPGRLLDAGRRVAVLLNEVGKRQPDDQRAALPEAMARYITADLEHVRDEI